MIRIALMPLALLAAAPAAAKVVSATETSFVSEHSFLVPARRPDLVWGVLIKPSAWWSKAHTYSGDSVNLTLDIAPGGCWCEKLPHGAVEHMRTIQANRYALLRLSGGLGPLQSGAVNATLTFQLKPEGDGTRVAVSYVVSGYHPAGLKALAPAVDAVLEAQWTGLRTAALKVN